MLRIHLLTLTSRRNELTGKLEFVDTSDHQSKQL
jgi:hypothetical protein